MFPKEHVIYSTVLCAVLFPFFGWNLIITFFVSTILIDIDHYIWYVQKNNDYTLSSIRNFYNHLLSGKKTHEYVLHIFHTIEFWCLMILLSFFSRIFIFVIIGIAFHVLLDHIYIAKNNLPNQRANSILEWLAYS